ncbi:MAG: biotin--[acetyl-CoA-carboxylase] ligase [Negativicutes bacterium]|nr:biotin--[acetyl-CoA-carboxylase] ligase [Negativicutes bacterium]MBP9536961.1 biotin--[acetyl-CoA-carboxylase] ligase [Negativicutes bacterium]MBP9949126.1 biotin--[acetyl-CoA-carboxylase] ligase [Negativicutes bacterium]
MRSKVLTLLKNSQGEYISGEEIARKLQVSRTAIWKHIRDLKEAGYLIQSHYRKGYSLQSAPDLLLPEELKANLKTKLLGSEIHYFDDVDSTNNIGKLIAAKGCLNGSVIVSESQNNGRGRLERGWYSPKSAGIWFSVILKPKMSPQNAPKFTLLAAVAVARAIENITGIKCGIKWPNDILYDGKKLVGILTEMNAEIDCINYIVIGIGLNVNNEEFPEELTSIATSLKMIKTKTFSRLALLSEILEQLEQEYQKVLLDGFADTFNAWREYSATLGNEIKVLGIEEQFSGKALDIDEDGALLVETEAGIKKVLAGDVSIRPK